MNKLASQDFPCTIAHPVIDEKFGYSLVDPYRWLEDGSASEVKSWSHAQHTHTIRDLRRDPEWQTIYDQLHRLRTVGEISVPEVAHTTQAYLFRSRGQNQAVLYTEEDGKLTVIHDPNQAVEPSAVDWFHLSPDARYVAYGISQHGDEWSTLYVYDRSKQEQLREAIPRTRGASMAFDPDGRGFYYTRYPLLGHGADSEKHYSKKVYWHRWNNPYDHDPVIFEDPDPRAIPTVSLSGSGRYLLVQMTHGWTRDHIYVQDRDQSDFAWREVGPKPTGIAHPYWVQDNLFLHTNRRYPLWEVVAVDMASPEELTKVLGPHASDPLYDVGFFQKRIVAHYLSQATSRLETFSLTGESLGPILLPAYSHITGMAGTWEGPLTIFGVTSFNHPLTTYTWSSSAADLAVDHAPDPDSCQMAVKQLWTQSKDGTEIPYFLIHPVNWDPTTPTPTVISGYGGFSVPMLPNYSPSVRRWVEKGGLYVMATLRGGSEFGEHWHESGMLHKKQNVFDDFRAVILDVQRRGFTDANHTAVSGRSNGGLLVGALMTQHPELVAAVVCGVPLLDMIRYPYFQIAALWTHEYGSPDNKEEFQTLLQYSPYHNVRSTVNYPASLFFTSEEDSRVDPLHARKMVALLQNLPGQNRPIYLRVQTEAGHGVGKTVDQWVIEESDIWSFITQRLNPEGRRQTTTPPTVP